MEEMQKLPLFVCTVEGCSMRFTSSDSFTVHKKKHEMVLNLGNGQKTNVFVADQTPTPTRFIRNCEEVGLFQDLQNVNPFEETFRKAVEASRVGGSQLEVQSLHVPAATDDTLHTPHVFPNITEEHGSITNLISSDSVTGTSTVQKSQSREELETLQVPSILQSEPTVVDVSDGTTDLKADLEVNGLGNAEILVKQESDTSQQISSRASSVGLGCKIPACAVPSHETVQVMLRMPDGRLVQLSGMSMDSIPSTQLPVQVPPAEIQTAPITKSSTPNAVIINTQFIQTGARVAQVDSGEQQSIVPLQSTAAPVPVPNSSSSEMVVSPQARLSAAKMKLKQRIQFNSKRKQSPPKEMHSNQASQKRVGGQRAVRAQSSESSDTSVCANSRGKRTSNSSSDVDEQKLKFRERNRAAAMRCREKRKHWILELEKRADETQRMNQQLTAEVTKLRSELVQLKTLLLAHKDCSVTRAMQQGVGITITRPVGAVKASSVSRLEVQQPAVSIPRVPMVIPGAVNMCASPDDPHPKVVLLSKPAGLKRRRQAALAALSVVENGGVQSKRSQQVESTQPTHTVPMSQQLGATSDSLKISNNTCRPEEVKASIVSEPVTTTPQTCLITVTAPTLIAAGVPAQSIAIKPGSLTSTSYLMPTKHSNMCLPDNNSTVPQFIKLNSNILKNHIGSSEGAKTNNLTQSNGDSMDSGHGSDIEILAEIPIKADGKS